MRKMLTLLACLALLISVQAGANVASLTTIGNDFTEVDNVRVPKAPDRY